MGQHERPLREWGIAVLLDAGAEVSTREIGWSVDVHGGELQGTHYCADGYALADLAKKVSDAAPKVAKAKRARGTKRTDIHRPGAIIPADYTLVMSYYMGGMQAPSIKVDCERGDWRTGKVTHGSGNFCCVRKLVDSGAKFARSPGAGKCSICGAHFNDGDVWVHIPSGEYLHVGRDCAAKYEMLSDRSAHELELGRAQQAKATQVQRAMNVEARRAFLDEHPGLEEALKVQHETIEDIERRFIRDCAITDKQIALVMRIADRIRNPPPPRAEEPKVDAPIGRVTFRGVIVSMKSQDSDYGITTKITIKMTTPQGVWLAWGTAPRLLLEEMWGRPHTAGNATLKGAEVEITATLRQGQDKHFALMGRPTGVVVAWPADASATAPGNASAP